MFSPELHGFLTPRNMYIARVGFAQALHQLHSFPLDLCCCFLSLTRSGMRNRTTAGSLTGAAAQNTCGGYDNPISPLASEANQGALNLVRWSEVAARTIHRLCQQCSLPLLGVQGL